MMTKRTINMWNLSGKEFYVNLRDSFLKRLFKHVIAIYGNQHKLAKLLGKHDSVIYNYQHRNRSVSLEIIRKVIEMLPENEQNEWKTIVEENLEEIRCKGNLSKVIKNPKFPITFKPLLFKILGHIVGDGYIEVDNLAIGYTNQRIELIEEFKKNVNEIFGKIIPHERITKGNTYNIRYPIVLSIILSNLLGSVYDLKNKISSIILQSDEKSKSLFLRALFDDEGYVVVKKYQIGIEMTNKEIIETIKKLLSEFGIETGKISEKIREKPRKPIYEVRISGRKNLNLFYVIIGFDHPLKRDKIQVLLNSYKSI